MFESEQAARSRLQFISQLAGSAAGMSMLAACGGLTNSSGSNLTPSAPSAAGTRLMAGNFIGDTPEFQKLLFKTDTLAVSHGTVGVIRDDMKSNAKLVAKFHEQLARAKKRLSGSSDPTYLCSPGDDGDCNGGGDEGGDYDGVPTFSVTVYATTYADDDDGQDAQYAAIMDPWDDFPRCDGPIFTVPKWVGACTTEELEAAGAAATAIATWIQSHGARMTSQEAVTFSAAFEAGAVTLGEYLGSIVGICGAAGWLAVIGALLLTGTAIAKFINCAKGH